MCEIYAMEVRSHVNKLSMEAPRDYWTEHERGVRKSRQHDLNIEEVLCVRDALKSGNDCWKVLCKGWCSTLAPISLKGTGVKIL
jgi:hypothetical protein